MLIRREDRGMSYLKPESREKTGRIVQLPRVEIFQTTPGNIAGRASIRIKGECKGVPERARFIVKAQKDVKAGDALEPLHKNITAEQAAVFSRVGEFVINIHNNLETERES